MDSGILIWNVYVQLNVSAKYLLIQIRIPSCKNHVLTVKKGVFLRGGLIFSILNHPKHLCAQESEICHKTSASGGVEIYDFVNQIYLCTTFCGSIPV